MSGVECMLQYEEWVQNGGGEGVNSDMLLVGLSAHATDDDLETAFMHGEDRMMMEGLSYAINQPSMLIASAI